MQTFASFGLAAPILKALDEQGYQAPTPIQSEAIAPAMAGRDVLACAQTGTGKTAAFLLPTIHGLLEGGSANSRSGHAGPRVLVLSPTRELASQIADSFATYAAHTRLRQTTVVGGVSQHRQERALSRGVDLLVATPGRLMDLMEQGVVDLSGVEVFVLDEADRMLDMGFIRPIQRIAKTIPTPRQTLMFSATLPRAIAELARTLLDNPVRITVARKEEEAPLIQQSVYPIRREQKQALLEHLLAGREVERAIVFTRTKHGADRVNRKLRAAGVRCDAIHGDRSQSQRERALSGFRSGQSRVLVATDVAARGLDVDGVTHVFNFDLPDDPESYVHRIGRTGRAGAQGVAIAFCDPQERKLLRAIETEIGGRVPLAQLPQGGAGDRTDVRHDAREDAPQERPSPARPRTPQKQKRKPAPANNRGNASGGGKWKNNRSRRSGSRSA